MADNLVSVCLRTRRPGLEEEIRNTIASVPGFRIADSRKPDGCDILILEIGDDPEGEFHLIQELQDSCAVRDIFLTSARNEPDILLRALRSGAREFFPQPLVREDLLNALTKFSARHREAGAKETGKKKGKIISVIGSKGGVGTTTVAVNFAGSLLESGGTRRAVALIDMNLLFGEVPLFLDMKPVFNWGEVARNISRLDSTYLMSVLSRHQSGVCVLPSPTGLDGVNAATPDIIERLLRLMQKEFDYIVIDGGQHLDAASLKVLELSDTVLIVSILSLPCLIIVKRLLETFRRLGYPSEENTKVIANRYHKNAMISLKEAEKGLGKRIFWSIPNDFQTTISAINQGKTLACIAGGADITKSIEELTTTVTAKTEKKPQTGGLLGLRLSGQKA